MIEKSHLKLIFHDCKLSNCSLDMEQVRVLVEENRTPLGGASVRHSMMVLDYQKAFTQVLHQVISQKPLTIDFIQSLAATLLRRTQFAVRGLREYEEFRKKDISILDGVFTKKENIETELKQLLGKVNSELDSPFKSSSPF